MARPKIKHVAKKSDTPSRANPNHGVIRRHYYSYMPNKKHHRLLIWAVFLCVVVTIAGQMLYPPDRAVPRARIGGNVVGWQEHDQLAKTINDKFMATKLSLGAEGTHPVTYTLGQAGAEPQADQMINQLMDYPFGQRFVPLSIFWQQPNLETLSLDFNQSVLEKLSRQASKKMTQPPTNAGLAIKDGQLVATEDQPGIRVEPTDVQRAITAARLAMGETNQIDIPAEPQPAVSTSADFAAVKTRAEAALMSPVSIAVDGQIFQPSRSQKALWLTIGSDARGAPALEFEAKKFTKYLTSLDKKVGHPAGITIITVVDGKETERDKGKVGRAIDKSPLVDLMQARLIEGLGTGVIYGELVDVAPSISINNRYTSSQAGLRAYVSDAARDQNANISVQQLGGEGWSASAEGGRSTVSASTYKLYVALVLFDKMDQGKIGWNDPMLDTTVSGCFDRMTIASTNPCPREWLSYWGRDYTNNFLYARGFSRGTDFTNTQATHTTANDLTKFMVGLENGSLIDGAQRDRLLHSLHVHPFQAGVPAGSAGQVYDKVGFLWDYVHDAAIVRHPKGTYVVTIMTKGRSYATIADITREIERIMYP